MNEKYKCNHSLGTPNKHLTLACGTCLKAWNKRYNKLSEFVKSISDHYNFSESETEFIEFYVEKEQEAYEILKEIGEIND